MIKKLIDSNILVYAFDESDLNKHKISTELIENSIGEGNCFLSIQNLAEFSRALEKSKSPAGYGKTSLFVSNMARVFEIVGYTSKTIIQALEISSNHKLRFFDALLAATMEENSIAQIVTENSKDSSKIPWLEVVNPFDK